MGARKYQIRFVEDYPWRELKGKILPNNPDYDRKGRKVRGKWGYMDALARETPERFLHPLVESLEREGMIEPTVTWSLPEGEFIHFGLSRLQALHRASRPIRMKAIVADYHGRFADQPLLETQEEVLACFKSPPYIFDMGPEWLWIHNCRDWHLEERLNIHHPQWDNWKPVGEPEIQAIPYE